MGKVEGEKVEKIKHFSHPHLLVLNEGGDKGKEAQCQACLESLLFGPSLSCEQHCEFHLHKLCAQAPLKISHSPFHREHRRTHTLTLAKTSLVDHSNLSFSCDLCHENRDMFFYHCSSSACHFSLDIKCALLLHHIEENFHEIKYVAHEHPLTLIENSLKIKNIELQTMDCQWCCKPMVESAYVCLNCRYGLHKNCARLPAHINHPCHREHPLLVRHKSADQCQLCQGQGEKLGLFYSCLPCMFDIHIKCVALGPRSSLEDKTSHHDHPFTLTLRNEPFICDACGIEGKYVSYICCICHVMIHKKCISLPRYIRSTRHHHIVTHNYFFQKKYLKKHDCGICLSKVKMKYGCYSCLKRNCNYVAHVNCAMEMYEKIDHIPEMYEDIGEDVEESSEDLASIIRVLEWNQHGEAIKIRHFSHDHDLKLNDKIKIKTNEEEEEDDGDKKCDGCMLYISTSFYYCSQCEFLLHKTCAELPRKRHHWFHPSLTILSKADIFRCDRCNRLCSGLVYKSSDESSAAKAEHFCLKCTGTSHTLTCQGPGQHEHSLFFDLKFKGRCYACGATCENGAFKCKDCTWIAFDFACITLPQVAWHKSDEHPLKLTFHEENDDPEQRCCDICEKRRNRNHWFYSCTICNNSAHPRCILGKHPFIKSGSTWPESTILHEHKLIFTRKIDDYAKCSKCFKHCQDEALKCEKSTCNFIIHCGRCELEQHPQDETSSEQHSEDETSSEQQSEDGTSLCNIL